MIDTPSDLLNLTDNAEAIEDLGIEITMEVRRYLNNPADPRTFGEVSVDFVINPANLRVVAPVLVAAGWRPPEHATEITDGLVR